jgi:hypothetical protein
MGADRESLILAKKYELFKALVKLGIIMYISYTIVYILSIISYNSQDWYSTLILLGVLLIFSVIVIWGVILLTN